MSIDGTKTGLIISEKATNESVLDNDNISKSKVVLDDAQLQQITKDIEIKNISHHNNLIIGVFVVILLTIWNLYHTSYVTLQDRMETVNDKHDQSYISLLAKTNDDYNSLQNKYRDLDKRIYKIEIELESLTSLIHTLTSQLSTPTK